MLQPNQKEILVDMWRQKFLLSHKWILKRLRENLKDLESAYKDWIREIWYNDPFDYFLDETLTFQFWEEYLRARKMIYPITN